MLPKISARYWIAAAPFLLIADLALGVLVYRTYTGAPALSLPAHTVKTTRKEIKPPMLPSLTIPAGGPFAGAEAVVEHNLFHAGRNRIAGAKQVVSAVDNTPVAERSQLELVGILLTPTKRLAFLNNQGVAQDGSQKQWVEEGGKCWGLKLAGVARDQVTIETQSAQNFTLDLYKPNRQKDRGAALSQEITVKGFQATEAPVVQDLRRESPVPAARAAISLDDRSADGKVKGEQTQEAKQEVEVVATPFGPFMKPAENGKKDTASPKAIQLPANQLGAAR